ncbi:MAG: 30S ribosomal protein S16 [Candidatus Saganbacteria bacterium]|nr:30S ribosomal protein S16 [Candidatus Saganbacteria bacterium]
MAAKIKLKRVGKTKKPFYRIVIQDEATATKGEAIEVIGRYNPIAKENKVQFDSERTKYWLSKGAAPTDKVRIFLGKAGFLPEVSFEGATKRASKEEEGKIKEEKAKAAEAAAKAATAKAAAPKAEAPKVEAPKAEEPKTEATAA